MAVCLEERDVEETVDHTNTDDQGPLRAPEIVDPSAVLNPQNLQAAIRTCERLNVEIFLFLLEILLGRRTGLIAGDVGVDHGVVSGVQLGHFEQQAGVVLVDTLDGAVLSVPVVYTVLNINVYNSILKPHTTDYTITLRSGTLTFQGSLMLTEEARK